MLDEGRARKPDDEENGDQRTFASVRLGSEHDSRGFLGRLRKE